MGGFNTFDYARVTTTLNPLSPFGGRGVWLPLFGDMVVSGSLSG